MKTIFELPTRELSYEEAATILGCSRAVVERLVRIGRLPCIRHGARCVKIDSAVLREFIATREKRDMS